MREQLSSLLCLTLLCSVKRTGSIGRPCLRPPHTGDSNFQVLLGDVELGPLSQQPDLFKVAAIQNELVNVTDNQQTAVVTAGVNIRLDWSNWVNEVLGGSITNASYTYYRTQLDESGTANGTSVVLQQSEHIIFQADKEMGLFYVEIVCVMVFGTVNTPSDRAIFLLEACIPQSAGISKQCYRSNITLFAIESPEPLVLLCGQGAVGGRSFANCFPQNINVSLLLTCTIVFIDTAVSEDVPCDNIEVSISTKDYRPGTHNFTAIATDIFGRVFHHNFTLQLAEPLLRGSCDFVDDGLNVYCQTSLDNDMVTLTFACSYDRLGGPPQPCDRNITIDRASFAPGLHVLEVTISTPRQGIGFGLPFQVFGINCTVNKNRTFTVQCEGISGVINDTEVECIYDSGSPPEKCELPFTIDIARYDRDSGEHNITIVANSTSQKTADDTPSFTVQDIECVQLMEPGRTTVICQFRVMLDRERPPFCLFDLISVNHECSELSNIVIIPSEIPLISEFILPRTESFLVSAFDSTGTRITTSLQVQLTADQMVECSTSLNCNSSSNITMMSARECCVNSNYGLSYAIPGQPLCHNCIVFGWVQESFSGIEKDSPYNLTVGYLKGAEQVGADAQLTLNVMVRRGSTDVSDLSLETTRVRVRSREDDSQVVFFSFIADGIVEEANETLTLQLVPTPATLQIMPIGEGVFFKHESYLTIMDLDVVILISCLCYCYSRQKSTKISAKKPKNELWEGVNDNHLYLRASSVEERAEISVRSSFQLNLPPHLIFSSSSIQLNETIGQGEFGIVYKGHIKKSNTKTVDEYLAIKTLKGFYDASMVKDMLKECSRMYKFDHIHVLTLKGVCLDGGPAPYIIMPFMANGSLLAYLKKNRKNLVISLEDADTQDVEVVRKQLMDMSIQIAKGMEYLASMKVVHRDLAARNCMIDARFVIKVADFGLSESIGVKEYFRQDQDAPIKLPLKWLPPESITDYIFSEKSDVWAYGVTCWEIFSGGKVPYSEVVLRELPKMLVDGYRLEKPLNSACNEDMHSFMQQCWSLEPEHRPMFSQLVESLSSSLEGMAGYVHIGAFGLTTQDIPHE